MIKARLWLDFTDLTSENKYLNMLIFSTNSFFGMYGEDRKYQIIMAFIVLMKLKKIVIPTSSMIRHVTNLIKSQYDQSEKKVT